MRVCVYAHRRIVVRVYYVCMRIDAYLAIVACVDAHSSMLMRLCVRTHSPASCHNDTVDRSPGMRLCVRAHRVGRAGRASPGRVVPTLYIGAHGAPFPRCRLTLATVQALPSTRPIKKPHTVGERCAGLFPIVWKRSKPVAIAPCPLPLCLIFTPSNIAAPVAPPSAGPYFSRRPSRSVVCLSSRCPGSLATTSGTVPAPWPPPRSPDPLPLLARRLYAPPPPPRRFDL